MNDLLRRFIRDEEGQDLIEYALLAGFIALAVVALLFGIGTNLNTLYTKVQNQVSSAAAGS